MDYTKIKFSVLLSIYKNECCDHFIQCIESIMCQTVLPTEIVLIKDGPLTEELEKTIKKLQKKIDILKVYSLEENVGLGLALQYGVNQCQYEYIARMDTDDIALKNRFEKQLTYFQNNPNVGIVGSSVAEFIGDVDNVISYRNLPSSDEEIKKYARKRNPLNHPTVIFKKEAVLQAGNYRSYYLCEDYDLWTRMIMNGTIFYNLNEVLVYMRTSKNFYKRRGGRNYSKNIKKLKKELFQKKFYSLSDYIISLGSHIIVSHIPNYLRKIIYMKLLRSNAK